MPAAVETPIKSGVSASDISDAELPVSQSEKESSDDLEDMEKARAELLVRIVLFYPFDNMFLRERGMASTLKMEYQVFLCIFPKNSVIATLGLKEMGKFLWEGREKGGKSRKKRRARIKKQQNLL